jgi:hypothetical protein
VPSPKERKKEKPQRDRDTERKNCNAIIVRMFFSQILGKMGKLIHVALEGVSILGY